MEPDPGPLVRRFEIRRHHDGLVDRAVDAVAVEEPLGIFITYSVKASRHTRNLALTMRTPGHDLELTAGYLVSEAIVRSRPDLLEIRSLGSEGSNEVIAELAPTVDVDLWRLERETLLTSSCGICGKRVTELLLHPTADLASPTGLLLSPNLIAQLPIQLRSQQGGFGQTGGLHAAAFIDTDGNVASAFEDIGRHNALDKLIGHLFLQNQLPLAEGILFLSSRSSFELIQKAARAGAVVLATVGAPSSLAVTAARELGMTLIGFVRQERFNVYAGEWRIRS
jgi:FdhD protein